MHSTQLRQWPEYSCLGRAPLRLSVGAYVQYLLRHNSMLSPMPASCNATFVSIDVTVVTNLKEKESCLREEIVLQYAKRQQFPLTDSADNNGQCLLRSKLFCVNQKGDIRS